MIKAKYTQKVTMNMYNYGTLLIFYILMPISFFIAVNLLIYNNAYHIKRYKFLYVVILVGYPALIYHNQKYVVRTMQNNQKYTNSEPKLK